MHKYQEYKKNLETLKSITCFFTGGRPQSMIQDTEPFSNRHQSYWDKVHIALLDEIDKAVKNGYRRFVSGLAQGVDMCAFDAVETYKASHPNLHIRNIVFVPFEYQASIWPNETKIRWYDILMKADEAYLVSQLPKNTPYNQIAKALNVRNYAMLSVSNHCIAVHEHTPTHGGTKNAMDAAKQHGLTISLRLVPFI